MGLFGEMFKDLSEMGSPIGKLRGKFADLSKLLTDYSFGESRFSPELAKQKIIVTFNEALEIADKCSNTDSVRLYFPSKTVEPSVTVAMKAAEYWVDFVLENGKQFTNSLAIQLIERAENDVRNEVSRAQTTSNSQTTLSNLLPNFAEFMKEMSAVVTNCHRVTDSETKLEYKAPILTYGRIMGYNHYIIEKNSNGNYEIYQVTLSNGGQHFRSAKKTFSHDESFDNYNEMFQGIAMEQMTNPLYLQIATSGF